MPFVSPEQKTDNDDLKTVHAFRHGPGNAYKQNSVGITTVGMSMAATCVGSMGMSVTVTVTMSVCMVVRCVRVRMTVSCASV